MHVGEMAFFLKRSMTSYSKWYEHLLTWPLQFSCRRDQHPPSRPCLRRPAERFNRVTTILAYLLLTMEDENFLASQAPSVLAQVSDFNQ